MIKNCLSNSSCKVCPSHSEGIFAGSPERDLDFLDQCHRINLYKKGQIVFYENNLPFGFYCVRSGKVKIYKSTIDGKQKILRFATRGDCLGYADVLSHEPNHATAEVVEDAEICFFAKNIFLLILEKQPYVAMNLLKRASKELNSSEEKLSDIAYKTVRVRLLELLLEFQKKYGIAEKDGWRLGISLSREEMAQAIGSSMETVVRLLKELKDEDLIRINKREIFIPLPKKLAELSQSGL